MFPNQFKIIMKKYKSKLIGIAITVIGFSSLAIAQSFQGTIEFKKVSVTDSTNYVFFVKEPNVRIDELGTSSHGAEGTFLVNLKDKTMKSLNHDRKLYIDQQTPPPAVYKGSFIVTKGSDLKVLQGYKCTAYTVTNNEEDTQITYWLAKDKFGFFLKLLHQLNRKDKSSIYFLQIPDTKNKFPMLSIQRDLQGNQSIRLEVTKIAKKEIDSKVFALPAGYSKMEK
jgi:hypothetical protein